MPKGKLRSIAKNRRKAYEALKRRGLSKSSAAAIANAGKTKKGRSRMARKAGRTRRARMRHLRRGRRRR